MYVFNFKLYILLLSTFLLRYVMGVHIVDNEGNTSISQQADIIHGGHGSNHESESANKSEIGNNTYLTKTYAQSTNENNTDKWRVLETSSASLPRESASKRQMLQSTLRNPQPISITQNPQMVSMLQVPQVKSILENPLMMSVLQNPQLMSILQTPMMSSFLENPQMLFMLMKYMANSNGDASSLQNLLNSFDGTVDDGRASILTVLEDFVLVLDYVLSPERLESEDQCEADFSAFIQGLRQTEMWALQMLDASGKPEQGILQGGLKFLGNYDECLGIYHTISNENTSSSHAIRGNYCHLIFTLPQSVQNVTSGNMPFSLGKMTLQWDLCLPMSCNDSHVMDAVSKLPLNATGMSVVSATFIQQRNWKEDKVAVAAVAVLCVVVFLSILGTLYDIITSEMRAQKERDSESGGNINNGFIFDHGHPDNNVFFKNSAVAESFDTEAMKEIRTTDKPRDGFGRQLLLSFSLYKNTEKVLSTKTGESNLGCIHGIRVLSMAWVILGHSMTWDSMRSWRNVVNYANWMRRFTMQFLVNGTLSVDTFFVLSGCLVTYLFLKESKRSRTSRPTFSQMVQYYVHRWWRLTPIYMFIMLLYSGLLDYLIQGPLADGKGLLDKDNCREYWWRNILYINNFFEFPVMCMPVSWFLSNDMQFYIIAPLALLPLAFGVYWLGLTIISLLVAVHIVTYGYFEWQTDGSDQFVDNAESMNKIYIWPWCRVGVFAIGMFLGVLLHKTNCKIKIPRYALLIGWQVFLAIGLLCTYISYDNFRSVSTSWDVNGRIIHETLYRPGWGLFVSWIIFVCCTGHGGVINSILSWSAWMPLGKLTYGAYLMHPLLLSYTEYSARIMRYADIPFVSYHFIGTFAVAYALAFIVCVLVESPCMGLEKAVLVKLKVKK